MAEASHSSSKAVPYDDLIQQLADYICNFEIDSESAYQTAFLSLVDALGCAVMALNYPECVRLIEPRWAGENCNSGSRVPGTTHVLDPVQAAFSIGACLRWMDFNDLYLSAIPIHPSENYSAILPLADYLSQRRILGGRAPLALRDVLTFFIKSIEVLGILCMENSLFDMGYDNSGMIKIAIAPVVASMLGGNEEAVKRAASQAVIDGMPTGLFRKPPNVAWRKSWAPADAAARGIHLATISLRDETGLPEAFSADTYGFNAVYLHGGTLQVSQPFGTFFAENIWFKVPYPAEGTTQTALEAACKLHDEVKDRFDQIAKIQLQTSKWALDYACAKDPLTQLTNPAARDHDVRYVATIGLVFGDMTYDYYSDATAALPEVRNVLGKMEVSVNEAFAADFDDPKQRTLSNALQVFFNDGSSTELVTVKYSLGHPNRRPEGIPALYEKLGRNVRSIFTGDQADRIVSACQDPDAALGMAVNSFVDLWIPDI